MVGASDGASDLNQGDNPLASLDANLNTALEALNALEGVRVAAVSPSYYTEPQGLRDQAWFANRVARLECDGMLKPHTLLAMCLKIEDTMGRCRSKDPALRFGPRPIDIDLLLFGNEIIDTPSLIIPHPRMTERAFVLVPLLDVWLDALDGAIASENFSKQCIGDMLSRLPYRLENMTIWQ